MFVPIGKGKLKALRKWSAYLGKEIDHVSSTYSEIVIEGMYNKFLRNIGE
ncbi:MAG: hypothetical protein LBF17_02235 [Mediterranea sp.]|nr:hypothetical protein [Mediterranea sp.]